MLVKNVQKWVRNLSLCLLLSITSYFSYFFSQNRSENQATYSLKHSLSFLQSFQKFDNFSVLNYCVTRNKFFFSPSVGVGVNRTFYQQRFFPQFQVGFGYKMLCFKKMTISPEINVIFSSFSMIQRHYFSSLQAGYIFQYGNKIILVHRLNAGLLNERFENTLGSISSAKTIDWQFSLGIGYAFN